MRTCSTVGLVLLSSLGAIALATSANATPFNLPVATESDLLKTDAAASIAQAPSPETPPTGDPSTGLPSPSTLSPGSRSINPTAPVVGTGIQLQFLPITDPRIPADGRSTVTLEGQITDDQGQLINRDAIVTLSASAGKFIGADQDADRPGFQVLARDGKFTAQLQSTLAAQKVRIRAAVELKEEQVRPERNKPIPPIQVDNNGPSTVRDVIPPVPLTPLPSQLNPQPSQLEAYTQVEFITNLRPFIGSGVVNLRLGASGTDYYGSFADFLAPGSDGYRFDVNVAAFATGRVGDWLLTAAFNNQRPLNQTCDGTTRLFRDTQFCDQVYPVYGDSSTTDYLTPSIDSVYFRAERTSPVPGAEPDFLLWGDYSTPEFARSSQLFTATARQLHGLKVNYNLGDFQFTALYGNNLQGFQRDTIAPNGTSGNYFLSRRLVIGGSESVYLETEEITRPGTVVERKQLFRGPDYEIDYDRGSLIFRRPILATEFDLFGRSLVRRVVITYQYDGGNTGDASLYAGRLQYNFSRTQGLESWAGVSYLRQDEGDRDFELYGVDALVPLGKDGRIIAEIARSTNDSVFRGNIKGTAYRFEVNGPLAQGISARAYYRSVDEDFANDATFSFAPGQTRYGAEVAAKLSPSTQLLFQIDHEANYGIASAVRGITQIIQSGFGDLFNPTQDPIPGNRVDNSLTTIRAGVLQKLGTVEIGFDYVNRSRQDSISPNRLETGGDQLVSRLNVPLARTLTFRAQDERNIGGTNDPLYPDRTTVALDWAAYPGVTVRLAQQFLEGNSLYGSNSITSLDTLFDQHLTDDTAFTGRYSILNGVNGLTSQGAIGLSHRLTLAPGLRVNLGYERIFGDIFAYTAAGQQFIQPVAVGQSAASLGVTSGDSYSIGLEYTDNPNFKASGRFEYRNSDAGDNMVISAAAAGKLSPALTALVRYQQADYANQLLTDSGLAHTATLKLGLAYRNPTDDKFNALLRYEFRQNPSTIPDTINFGSGTGSAVNLFALETIYAPNYRWEFYGKFAFRDTKSYLARDLLGTNAVTLGQIRASYRFGYRWDVTGEVRWIGQSGIGFDEVGYVLELGYYLTPNLRVGAGYSFGGVSDRDFGDRDRGGFFVGLQLKLNELFSGFGLERTAPRQQQESAVKPVASTQLSSPTATQTVLPPIASPLTAVQPVSVQPAIGGQGQ